ncbi:MAG: LamG domain-containing protein [Mycobacterium sp.]
MPNKPDTILRIVTATSATADQSQNAANLTAATGGAYEATSTRTAISGVAREVSAVFQASDTGSLDGTIVYHGNTGHTTYPYELDTNSGNFRVRDNSNGSYIDVPLPGVTSTTHTYAAQVSWRTNPATTGTSDAALCEVYLENQTAGDIAVHSATLTNLAPSGTDNFSYGGRYDGTATLANAVGGTITEVRVGTRYHSTAEAYEDYGTGETSTGSGAINPDPIMPIPAALGTDGAMAGPAYLHAGAQAKASARRLASPIVNSYHPNAYPVGGWSSVFEEVSGTFYGYNDFSSPDVLATFSDGPGGANDRARDIENGRNQYWDAVDSDLCDQLTDGATDFTLSCWVTPESYPATTMWIFAVLDSGVANCPLVVWVNGSGQLVCGWEVSGTYTTVATSTSAIGTGSAVHLAVVCTHSGGTRTARMYIDGTQDGTGSAAQPTHNPTDVMVFGSTIASRGFDGLVHEIKIEPTAEGSEVGEGRNVDYEAGLPAGQLNPLAPLAWWRFHQPSDGYAPARNFSDIELGGDTYKAHANLYWRRPISPMFSQAKVRVLCEVTFTGTGNHDAIAVAVVSSTRRPGQLGIIGQPTATNYTAETIAATSSGDEYELEFSTALDLARDPLGLSHVYVATRIGAGSPTGDTFIAIKSVHVTPYQPTPGGSLPLAPGT